MVNYDNSPVLNCSAPKTCFSNLPRCPTAFAQKNDTRGQGFFLSDCNTKEQGLRLITSKGLDDTFFIYDIGRVVQLYKALRARMPRVQPCYAVKCNPEPAVIKALCSLGSGFECASEKELQLVLQQGAEPARVFLSQPFKRKCDVSSAMALGIQYTVFDSAMELRKLARLSPGGSFKCLLRLLPTGMEGVPRKYGAVMDEVPALLTLAKELGVQVVGLCFHISNAHKMSGLDVARAFSQNIAQCRLAYDMARMIGFKFEMLNLGGGFRAVLDSNGRLDVSGVDVAVNTALDLHFPPELGVQVLSEPGRFLVESCATMFAPIIGVRDRSNAAGQVVRRDYYITDGVYGALNCLVHDLHQPSCETFHSPILSPPPVDMGTRLSTVWGPTSDATDCVFHEVVLPWLRTGDWFMFSNMGAYTLSAATGYNGMPAANPDKFYVYEGSLVPESQLVETVKRV